MLPKNTFTHSKIYIIDSKIAYLGSLNFTENGFTDNFETRIRLTQLDKIEELASFYHDTFHDEYSLKSHDLRLLGQQVYTEKAY